jgi:hypothetical protein
VDNGPIRLNKRTVKYGPNVNQRMDFYHRRPRPRGGALLHSRLPEA